MKLLKSKKGAVTFYGIGVCFVLLVIYVVLLPTIDSIITSALPSVQESPLAVWGLKIIMLALLVKIVLLVTATKDQGYNA